MPAQLHGNLADAQQDTASSCALLGLLQTSTLTALWRLRPSPRLCATSQWLWGQVSTRHTVQLGHLTPVGKPPLDVITANTKINRLHKPCMPVCMQVCKHPAQHASTGGLHSSWVGKDHGASAGQGAMNSSRVETDEIRKPTKYRDQIKAANTSCFGKECPHHVTKTSAWLGCGISQGPTAPWHSFKP